MVLACDRCNELPVLDRLGVGGGEREGKNELDLAAEAGRLERLVQPGVERGPPEHHVVGVGVGLQVVDDG